MVKPQEKREIKESLSPIRQNFDRDSSVTYDKNDKDMHRKPSYAKFLDQQEPENKLSKSFVEMIEDEE